MSNVYYAYEVAQHIQQDLLKRYPPLFPDVLCHHITYSLTKQIPSNNPVTVKIEGFVSDDKVQAAVVSVDGERYQPNGRRFHITWSIDRAAGAKPAMSNALIASNAQMTTANYTFTSKPQVYGRTSQ